MDVGEIYVRYRYGPTESWKYSMTLKYFLTSGSGASYDTLEAWVDHVKYGAKTMNSTVPYFHFQVYQGEEILVDVMYDKSK